MAKISIKKSLLAIMQFAKAMPHFLLLKINILKK
jgi:hypothetical protein